ncbi:hypothetical protein NQD34_003533 [Periophthalmus magnuspinnatus]|nr:hypothetical protein NQD34_003533 [Periophthalmus magnuspinnatus]
MDAILRTFHFSKDRTVAIAISNPKLIFEFPIMPMSMDREACVLFALVPFNYFTFCSKIALFKMFKSPNYLTFLALNHVITLFPHQKTHHICLYIYIYIYIFVHLSHILKNLPLQNSKLPPSTS